MALVPRRNPARSSPVHLFWHSFDLAHARYSGRAAQEIIGRWFASRPAEVTDRVVLATEGRLSADRDINAVGSSRRALTRALDRSLRRLQRDNVDLYQLHAWDPITPIEETLSFLDGAVRDGKVGCVGLSNFTGWQLQLMVSTARRMGVQVPVTLQQQYSLLSRESDWEVVPAALHNGIGLLPWSLLAGGFVPARRHTRPGHARRIREAPVPVGVGRVRGVGSQLSTR